MSTKVPVELLVADFLKKKGYHRTLDIFQNEIGVSFDYDYEAVSFEPLEEIVQDRHKFLEHHYDGGLSIAEKSSGKGNNNNKKNSGGLTPSHKFLHLVKPWQFTNVENKKPLKLPDQLSNALCLNLSIGSIKAGHSNKHSNTTLETTTTTTKPVLLISANDRILKVVDLHHPGKVLAVSNPRDSKVIYKSFISIDGTDILVAGGMDGFAYIFQLPEEKKNKEIEETSIGEDRNCRATAAAATTVPFLKLLQKVKLHNRVITSIQYLPNCTDDNQHNGYLVSIGFDTTLSIAQISLSSDINFNHNNSSSSSSQQKQQVSVSQLSTFKLLSNATDIKVFNYKFTNNDQTIITTVPLILLSRLNSTLLSLFTLHNGDSSSNFNKGCQLVEVARISLNDAEFSNHEFSPMNITVFNPSGSRKYVIDQIEINNDVANLPLIAVATSHVPYMRIITVTLPLNLQEIITAIPAKITNTTNSTACDPNPNFRQSQLQQQELVGIPTKRGQIISNINSLSPQDKFSNPLIHWKSNGTGIWIAGDDGIIRGVNFAQNRLNVVKELKGYDGDKNENVGVRFKAFVGYVSGSGGDEEKERLVVASSDKQINIWE